MVSIVLWCEERMVVLRDSNRRVVVRNAKSGWLHPTKTFNGVCAGAGIVWGGRRCPLDRRRGAHGRWLLPSIAVLRAFFSSARKDLSRHESELALPNPIDGACVPPRRGERPRIRIPTEPQQQRSFQSRCFTQKGEGRTNTAQRLQEAQVRFRTARPRGMVTRRRRQCCSICREKCQITRP